MKCASSYLTTDTNIIVTLSKGGQDIRAHTQFITWISIIYFKDCKCQEVVVTFEDSNMLWEGKKWIETGSSWEAMVRMKLFENVQCSIWGFAWANMRYINSYPASSVVGQWKINCSLLVCNKSLQYAGGIISQVHSRYWLESWPMSMLPVGSSSSLQVTFYCPLKSGRALNKGNSR